VRYRNVKIPEKKNTNPESGSTPFEKAMKCEKICR
jgi:hypothetical protein